MFTHPVLKCFALLIRATARDCASMSACSSVGASQNAVLNRQHGFMLCTCLSRAECTILVANYIPAQHPNANIQNHQLSRCRNAKGLCFFWSGSLSCILSLLNKFCSPEKSYSDALPQDVHTLYVTQHILICACLVLLYQGQCWGIGICIT